MEITQHDKIKDEEINLKYLKKHKFDKRLDKLTKKLKDKTILLYGSGCFLQAIYKHYDLSKLNIIGVADKKYESNEKKADFLGYKTISPMEIENMKPDYVLIATKFYINIYESLTEDILKNSKIKVMPLVKKSWLTLIKEVWKA